MVSFDKELLVLLIIMMWSLMIDHRDGKTNTYFKGGSRSTNGGEVE